MKTTFLGIPMSQSPQAIRMWEDFLSELSFHRIIELGTYKWGMSTFFQLYCIQKKADFYTYDTTPFHISRLGRFLKTSKHFKKVDIFSIEKEIGKLVSAEGRTILYCDNGDKPKEIKVFSKYLKKGDYLVVHDWGTEVVPDDIPSNLKRICPPVEDELTAIFYV